MYPFQKSSEGYRQLGEKQTPRMDSQPVLSPKDETQNRVWMVAEDDPVLRSILKTMITLWEADSLVFADGNEAWAWLDQVEQGVPMLPLPEVALLDIKMPGYQGYEVGARMRAIAATRTIPQLIMTAYHLSDEDKAQIYESARPELLISKPFPAFDEFRCLIETTIAVSKSSSNTLRTNPHRAERADHSLESLAAHQWRGVDMKQNGFSLMNDKWGDG